MGSDDTQDTVIHLVDWMREVDLHIFEILSLKRGLIMNAGSMEKNTDYTRWYLNQRSHELVDMGVLEEPFKAHFMLTDEAYEAWVDQDADRMAAIGSDE